MDFNLKAHQLDRKRRNPVTTEYNPSYLSYEDVRGEKAEAISSAMGIKDKLGLKHTAHLIELRHAEDHIRISAHGKNHFQEVMVFQDTSVIVLDIDIENKEGIQTVYSPNGDIEVLMAGWDEAKSGYSTGYTSFSLRNNCHTECLGQWQKYEKLIFSSKANITRIGANRSPY